jgi:hypothetical protein
MEKEEKIMVNKKFWLGIMVLTLIFGNFITGCVSVGKESIGANLKAKDGESEITIYGGDRGVGGGSLSLADITITIDGQQKGVIKSNGSAKIIVSNGDHILSVKYQGTGILLGPPLFSDPFSFTANSESIIYVLDYPATTFGKINFILSSKTKL